MLFNKQLETVDAILEQFSTTLNKLKDLVVVHTEGISKNDTEIASLSADSVRRQQEIDRATKAADKIAAIIA